MSKKKEIQTGKTEKTGKKHRKLAPVFCRFAGTLILLCVIAFGLFLTVPRFLGYEIYEIVSGSMEPAIPTGSLVLIKPEEPEQICPGDVIAFQSGDSVIVHRVVQNRQVEGEYITEGDANEKEDINTVPYADLIGIVELHIPELGTLMTACTTKTGKVYILCFAACGVMFHLLAGRLEEQ